MEISKRYYWHLFISISCSLSNKLNLPSFISRELKTSLKSGLTISKVDVYIRAIFFLHPTIFNHLHGLFNAWDWVGWRRQWCFNTCGDLLCCSFYLRTCALVQLKEWTLLILLLSSSRDFFMLPLFLPNFDFFKASNFTSSTSSSLDSSEETSSGHVAVAPLTWNLSNNMSRSSKFFGPCFMNLTWLLLIPFSALLHLWNYIRK